MPGGVGAAVVDASTFADYFLLYPMERARHERARAVVDRLSALGVAVYEPFLFEVELRSVLSRRLGPAKALELTSATLSHVNVVDEEQIHAAAAEVALLAGCRAAGAYYIATARYVDAFLVTSDKRMRDNAQAAGVEAYYLLDDRDYAELAERLEAADPP